MAYPTPPVLDPIAGTATPNLTTGGPYDEVLNKIEAYFAQLGAYVDAQIAAVRGEIPSTTDFATAEQLEEVKQSASDAASAAATAQETAEAAQATATAAQGAASTAQGAADEASESVATLEGNVSGISTKVTNILATTYRLPRGDGASTSAPLFNADGTSSNYFDGVLYNVLNHFALAAPKQAPTMRLGTLSYDGQTVPLTDDSSHNSYESAALTAAYGAGGITKSPDDPELTAIDLTRMNVSQEGIPYKGSPI